MIYKFANYTQFFTDLDKGTLFASTMIFPQKFQYVTNLPIVSSDWGLGSEINFFLCTSKTLEVDDEKLE